MNSSTAYPKNEENTLNLCIETSKTMTPTPPSYDAIDELLYDWFKWSQSYEPALGYGRADATCRDFTISRQWMDYSDISDQVDAKLRESVGKAVEPLIFELSLKHRIAIQTAMLNMDVGFSVWSNARTDFNQADAYAEAKELLRPKLMMKGLIDLTSGKI